jgi:hypothetical protein
MINQDFIESLLPILCRIPYNIRIKLLKNKVWILKEVERENSPYSLKDFDRYQCIFFHIPKCAGMSVAQGLFGNQGASHITLTHAKLIFGLHNFNNYFKFTFVRNPFDRVVSAYFFLKKGGLYNWISPWTKKYILTYPTFSEFATEGLPKREVINDFHFRPQYTFICDTKKESKSRLCWPL